MMLPSTFQELLDATDLTAWARASRTADSLEVDRALDGKAALLPRLAALLSPAAGERLEDLAAAAHCITVQRFGRVLQMYAPLYLSNECVDTCTYCGFSRPHTLHRITLSVDQVAAEAELLAHQGFRHVLLVSGEHPRIVDTGYLVDVVRRLRPSFASVAIEVAPQEEEDYRTLVIAGVDSLSVYQETYHRPTYAQVHVAGRKKNFDWRLAAPERAARAGMKRIGIASLLGLADWRHDGLAVGLHADWLQRRCWRSQITISVPRLRPALGIIDPPLPVSDRALVQLVCALRICLPDAGLVLSTRERPHLRDGLVRLGITQLSAGSHTEPGGYGAPDPEAEQFDVADHRTSQEVAARLVELGYDVVWKDWEPTLHGCA